MREAYFTGTATGTGDVGLERSSAELSRRARHQRPSMGEVVVAGGGGAQGTFPPVSLLLSLCPICPCVARCDMPLPAFDSVHRHGRRS